MDENFGSGFDQGFNEMSKLMNNVARTAISEQRANTYAQSAASRIPLEQAQAARIMAQIAEMPQDLALRQQQSSNGSLRDQLMQLNYQLNLAKFQFNKEQAANGGIGGKNLPAVQKNINAAMAIANQFGALDENGNVDESKIPGIYLDNYHKLINAATKGSSTSYSLNQAEKASNLMSTINSIDLSPLEYYSGSKGKARLKQDELKNLTGDAPPIYDQYVSLVSTTIPAAADQLGKFWGGSVQESADKNRQNIINPNNWKSNPDIVKKSFNNIKDIAEKEYKNSIEAINDPAFYKGSAINEPSSTDNSQNTPQSSNDIDQLANQLNSSPTSVNEAISKLESKGYTKQQAIETLKNG